MKEVWLPIPKTKNQYFVSNFGKVKHIDKVLKLTKNCKGYLCVGINQKNKNIHRLVAETFKPIPNCNKLVVNHIDGNKLNNNLDNLEWCTQKYNIFHASLRGSHKGWTDEDREKSKENRLNALRKKVECIETEEVFNSISEAALAKNTYVQNISKCCKSKLKTAGGFHWKYVA